MLSLLCAILMQSAAAGDSPAIAVAANLTKPMERIVDEFRKETGIDVRASYGASGGFIRQIREHAPFEMFISANADYARRVADEGLAEGERVTLAFGRLGVFVPDDSPLATIADLSALMNEIRNGQFRQIAMADPGFAPFGVAARQALEHAGVWAIEKDRVVLGENAGQAAQFTLAGGVDAGFIPVSFALDPDVAARGRFFPIPPDWHAPLEQCAILLKGAGAGARRFFGYLREPAAQAVLERYGYALPGDGAVQ